MRRCWGLSALLVVNEAAATRIAGGELRVEAVLGFERLGERGGGAVIREARKGRNGGIRAAPSFAKRGRGAMKPRRLPRHPRSAVLILFPSPSSLPEPILRVRLIG